MHVKKMRSSPKNRRNYKLATNEYVKMREAKQKYEKDVIDKCGGEPKLFYRHKQKMKT